MISCPKCGGQFSRCQRCGQVYYCIRCGKCYHHERTPAAKAVHEFQSSLADEDPRTELHK